MTENSTKIIEIDHLRKQFGDHEVLKDISLSVHKGEVVSIIGSSGSGKSTMLRCINLLETPTAGDILYKGKSIMSRDTDIRKYRAEVGMVFQQFNLFNNMTALKNCMIGQMKVLGRSREEAQTIAMEYLEKVGMSRYVNAKPRQLSGGQKQRVAIARTLSMSPEVILFDDKRPRPRNGRRGAHGNARACRGGLYDDSRNARDVVCTRRFEPRDIHG